MAYSGHNDQRSYYGLAASYAEYADLVDPNYYQPLLPAVGGGEAGGGRGRSGPWGFGWIAPLGGGAPAERSEATGGGKDERRRRGARRPAVGRTSAGGEERGSATMVGRSVAARRRWGGGGGGG